MEDSRFSVTVAQEKEARLRNGIAYRSSRAPLFPIHSRNCLLVPVTVRILIIGDSAPFREGLRALLEDHADWEVCGEAGDALGRQECDPSQS